MRPLDGAPSSQRRNLPVGSGSCLRTRRARSIPQALNSTRQCFVGAWRAIPARKNRPSHANNAQSFASEALAGSVSLDKRASYGTFVRTPLFAGEARAAAARRRCFNWTCALAPSAIENMLLSKYRSAARACVSLGAKPWPKYQKAIARIEATSKEHCVAKNAVRLSRSALRGRAKKTSDKESACSWTSASSHSRQTRDSMRLMCCSWSQSSCQQSVSHGALRSIA